MLARTSSIAFAAECCRQAGPQRHAVGRARWRASPRPRPGRCRPRRSPRRRTGGGDRQHARAAAVVEHALPRRRRAGAWRAIQRRHIRVVGCVPVPKAMPGSSRITALRAGAARRDQVGTIQKPGVDLGRPELRLRQPHPVPLVDRRRSPRSAHRRAAVARRQRGRRRGGRGLVGEQGADAGPLPAAARRRCRARRTPAARRRCRRRRPRSRPRARRARRSEQVARPPRPTSRADQQRQRVHRAAPPQRLC